MCNGRDLQVIRGKPLFAEHVSTQLRESRGHVFGYPKVSDGSQRVQGDHCLPQQEFMCILDACCFSPGSPDPSMIHYGRTRLVLFGFFLGGGRGGVGSLTMTSMLRAGACQSADRPGPDGAQSELLTANSCSIVIARQNVAAVCVS